MDTNNNKVTPPTPEQEQASFRKFKRWAIGVNAGLLILAILFFFLAIWLGIKSAIVGGLLLLVQALYAGTSLEIVSPIERGVMLFFGKPLFNVTSGLKYVPWMFCSLYTESLNWREQEIPGEPEQIWRGEGSPPEGKIPPIRVNHKGVNVGAKTSRGANDERQDDALERSITSEPSAMARYRVTDPMRFLLAMGGDRLEAERQINDLVVSAILEEFPKYTFRGTQERLEKTNEKLLSDVVTLVKDWGLEVDRVRITVFHPTKRVNEGLSDAAKAQTDIQKEEALAKAVQIKGEGEGKYAFNKASGEAKAVETMAHAERTRLQEEGSGRAFARQAEMDAETVALDARRWALGVGGSDVMGYEVGKRVAEKADHTFFVDGDGIASVVGTASAIIKEARGKKTEKPNQETV